MNKEDRKFRKEYNQAKSNTLTNMGEGAKYGINSAWNFFNLQYRDLINKSNRDLLAVEQIERFDKKPNPQKVEDLTQSIEKLEDEMTPYREAELQNLREYQAFYDNIDNLPARYLTGFTYGAIKNNLNPIEFARNSALNLLSLGQGNVFNFGFQMLVDTTDNLLSNRYDDELLGIIRSADDKELVEAGGGALLTNTLFPALKWTGRKIKGSSLVKNILNSDVIEVNAKHLKDVDVLDFNDPNPVTTLKNKKYIKEVKEIPNDPTFGINIKHEIKATKDLLETGHDSTGAVNFRQLADELIELGHTITKEATENKTKKESKLLKQGKSALEASKDTPMDRKDVNVSLERNIRGIVNNYIEKPIALYENLYKGEYHKAIREVSHKYDDAVLNIGPTERSVNERLAEDLADNTVADTILDTIFSKTTKFSTNGKADVDPIKLSKFGDDIVKEWREVIGLAVTHNTSENMELFRSSPKYEPYIYTGKNREMFDNKLTTVVQDFLNDKLSLDEFSKILFSQKDKFNFFKEKDSIEETFESYIAKVINQITGAESGAKYKEKIKSIFKNKKLPVEKIEQALKDIKERKINTAIMSLTFNKEQIFDFFIKNTDFERIKEVLESKLNLLEPLEGETQEEALKRFVKDLRITTNWKKNLNQDLDNINFDETISRDLIDVIKDSFKGKTTKEKMQNFALFAEYWKNDNITMLNLIESMTTTEKASLTALGIPFYRMKTAVNDEEGLLKLFYDVPVLRKDYDKIVEAVASDRSIAVEVQNKFLEVFNNYINKKDPFTTGIESDPIRSVEKATMWGLRNFFLALSGMGESFSHPVLAAIKGTEYFNGNFFKSAYEMSKVSPKVYGLALLRELKPIAGISVSLNKLYRGLGALIGGDDGELLASLELSSIADTITPKKQGSVLVEGLKGMADIVQDLNLHLQGSMQNMRYLSSSLLAIQKIKQLLNYDKFELLPLEDQKRFKAVYIDDDVKFQKWKADLNLKDSNNKTIGLTNALYKIGYSDETKYLHSSMLYDLYAEDPFKNLRTTNMGGGENLLLKVKTLFTSFTNDLLNYGWDKARYYKDSKGIYRKRMSTNYLKHITKNKKDFLISTTGGVAGITLLSLAGIAGKYLDSKVFGKSDDEKTRARLKAIAYSGDKGKYIADFALDASMSATGLDAFSQSSTGITEMLKTMKENNFVPRRVNTLYNSIKGTPIYNKPSDLDWYTSTLYEEEIRKDIQRRSGEEEDEELKQNLETFFNALDVAYTEALEESGQLPTGSGLEKKRELLGCDDKKEVEEMRASQNFNSIVALTLAQSDMDNVKNNFMINIEEAKEKDLLNKSTDEYLKDTGINKKLNKVITDQTTLTKEEQKKLDEYMKTVKDKDEFVRLLKEMGYRKYLLNSRKR